MSFCISCRDWKYSEIITNDASGYAIAQLNNGHYVIINANNKKETTGNEYDRISHARFNGYYIAEKYNAYTFLGYAGFEIVDRYYEDINLPEKLQGGTIARVKQNGKWGLLSLDQGIYIAPIKYDNISRFIDDIAVISLGNKYGLINSKGEILVPIKYHQIHLCGNIKYAFQHFGKWGIIDNGEVSIPAMYDKIIRAGKTHALVKSAKDTYKVVQLGTNIVSRTIHTIGEITSISDDYFAYPDNGFHYVNLSNGYPIDECFGATQAFSDGLAAVRPWLGLWSYGLWGYINYRGDYIIAPKFNDCKSFSEGLAAVKIGDKWGYINSQGELVIPCKYDFAMSFHDGYARVNNGGVLRGIQANFGIPDGGKWGIINTRGEEVIPIDHYRISDFKNGRAHVDGCIINTKMQTVIESYGYLELFDNYIRMDDSYYDLDGNFLFRKKHQ